MSVFDPILDDARARLRGARREVLGQWRTPRKVLGIGGDPKIVEVGDAWHVGALLLTDDAVFAVGEIIRSQDPGRRGYTAESARERAAIRAAALRGRIPAGTVVHVGWRELDLPAIEGGSADPLLSVTGGVPMIRWSTAGSPTPLAGYLAERVDLLVSPAPGA